MDIAQAKQELRRTIRAYTAKTEDGVYRMPRRMQRPVLLMGPPGIGKTAILSQLAQEEHIGLAAYTMTRTTRARARSACPSLWAARRQGRPSAPRNTP